MKLLLTTRSERLAIALVLSVLLVVTALVWTWKTL